MNPIISYDTLFLGLSALFALILCVWLCYEAVQFKRRHSRRHVLKAPVERCVTGRHERAWIGVKT